MTFSIFHRWDTKSRSQSKLISQKNISRLLRNRLSCVQISAGNENHFQLKRDNLLVSVKKYFFGLVSLLWPKLTYLIERQYLVSLVNISTFLIKMFSHSSFLISRTVCSIENEHCNTSPFGYFSIELQICISFKWN